MKVLIDLILSAQNSNAKLTCHYIIESVVFNNNDLTELHQWPPNLDLRRQRQHLLVPQVLQGNYWYDNTWCYFKKLVELALHDLKRTASSRENNYNNNLITTVISQVKMSINGFGIIDLIFYLSAFKDIANHSLQGHGHQRPPLGRPRLGQVDPQLRQLRHIRPIQPGYCGVL